MSMRHRYAFFTLSLLLATGLTAQEVQKCCGSSNSTFLLGNISYAKHSQMLFLPSDLANAQNGTISRIYFRYGNTGEDIGNTLTDLVIRMGHTASTAFLPGNTFFTDLDTILDSPVLSIAPGVAGDWFSFPVAPFVYSMDSTLILDIQIGNSATTNFGTYGTSNNGRKIYANDLSATTGSSGSTTWQDFGFDLGITSVGTSSRNKELRLMPLPGYREWQLTWPGGKLAGSAVLLFDATGKVLRTDHVASSGGPYTLDMSPFSTGIYMVQLRTSDGVVRTQRLFRP